MKCSYKIRYASFILLTGFFYFLLSISNAAASVIDAPHNETNAISCGTCHSYSLWWQFSPIYQNPTEYTLRSDTVCHQCHGDAGSLPLKNPHSSAAMDLMHNPVLGDWSTKCVDCHDPHIQGQLDWLTSDPANAANLYLATGTITAGSIQVNTNPDGTKSTTFDYTGANAKDNWLDPALWSVKTTNTRGLILVISSGAINDPDAINSTYEVNDVDLSSTIISFEGAFDGTGTIHVQGAIPLSFNAEDTNFGMIFGQLIKQEINTDNYGLKAVKFFDGTIVDSPARTGGFVELDSGVYNGICQVCHYYTKYYNADGFSPDPTDPNYPDGLRIAPVQPLHNSDTNCISCHKTMQGFVPINADHTFISKTGTTCANCHDDEDIVIGTHNGGCHLCHSGYPPELVSPFPSPKWPTIPVGTPLPGNCIDCHAGINNDFTSHPNANDHTDQVTSSTNCTLACHFHKGKDVISEIHAGVPATDPCIKCHNLSGPAPYTGDGFLISYASAGPGSCITCHGSAVTSPAIHPDALSHSGQVLETGTGFCSRCHTTGPSSDPVHDVHNGNCGSCHMTANGYALKSLAVIGPATCTECHGSDFMVHTLSNFNSYDHETFGAITMDSACAECHVEADPADLVSSLHGTNGCATCHQSDGYIIGSIPVDARTGHGLNDTGNPANTCVSCHTDKASHPSDTDHVALGHIVPVASCVTCHIGDVNSWVHNTSVASHCDRCHTSLHTDQVRVMRPGVIPNADCIECHTSIHQEYLNQGVTGHTSTISFTSHPRNKIIIGSHDGQVDGDKPATRSCQICHDGDPVWDVHYWMTTPPQPPIPLTCGNCHGGGPEGTLTGSAAGKGTGKLPGPTTFIYCVDCHIDPIYLDEALHQ